MSLHNNIFLYMKFPFEIENKVKLPFSDFPVIGKCTIKLEFDLFRKSTHAHRHFLNCHSRQHKMTGITF